MPRFHATPDGDVPFTPEEEAERDAEIAAWLAKSDERLAADVRKQRDEILAQSDWRVTKASEVGATLDPAWVVYRQELRDVPQQSGFPIQIIWPTPPGGG